MKYFIIAGLPDGTKHYMTDASTRLKGVEQLINREQYFGIHAARQSGTTTCLQDLAKKINERRQFCGCSEGWLITFDRRPGVK